MKRMLIGLLVLGSISAFAGNCRVLSQDTGINDVNFENGIMTINGSLKMKLQESSKRCGIFGPKENVDFYGSKYGLRVFLDDCDWGVSGLTGRIIDEVNGSRITNIVCYEVNE